MQNPDLNASLSSVLEHLEQLRTRHGGRPLLLRLRLPVGFDHDTVLETLATRLRDQGLGRVRLAVAAVPGPLGIASIDFAS
jgi:hypothetical protein